MLSKQVMAGRCEFSFLTGSSTIFFCISSSKTLQASIQKTHGTGVDPIYLVIAWMKRNLIWISKPVILRYGIFVSQLQGLNSMGNLCLFRLILLVM